MLLRLTTFAFFALAALGELARAEPITQTVPVRAPQVAKAVSDDPLASERALFTRPSVLKGNIAFWRKVFSEYSKHQSVIHDIRKPERVYQVLDFRQSVGAPGVQLDSLKNREEAVAKIRIAELLRQTAALAETPEAMSDDQRRLAALFADDPTGLISASDYIRVQRGLREQTGEAMKISGQYLPEMERIFEQQGLPRLLTRLPFVESSFNVAAYSKVAAAGLWQFMPSSAKMYMRFNNVADDRRDPWRSTRAAADHIKDDYRVLGDWPLAVTAYNYGRGGLMRALKEVSGNSLGDLVERFDSPRFGFASRNFYSEFVAATDVERDWKTHFEGLERRQAVRFDEVNLPRYTPWNTLVRVAGGDEQGLRLLNPAYREAVLQGKLYVPAGDNIRLPEGKGPGFLAAYKVLGSSQTFSHQREQFFMVKVRRGESLGAIATRYGVSQNTLKSLNGLKKGRVRAGMRLRVPNLGDDDTATLHAAADKAGDAVEVAAAPASEPARPATETPAACPKQGKKGRQRKACQPASKAADRSEVASTAEPVRQSSSQRREKAAVAAELAAASSRFHTVKPGQTLGSIANRYKTTVKALMHLNELARANSIRPGMKLKLPTV